MENPESGDLNSRLKRGICILMHDIKLVNSGDSWSD